MAKVWVKPYYRADGTKVAGYYRTGKLASKGNLASTLEKIKQEKLADDKQYRKNMRWYKEEAVMYLQSNRVPKVPKRQGVYHKIGRLNEGTRNLSKRFTNPLIKASILKRRARLK